MNRPMELLLNASKALAGTHSDESEPDVAQAVDYILQYLTAREAAEEYVFICKRIDRAQASGDMDQAAALMVERDKLMEVLQCPR